MIEVIHGDSRDVLDMLEANSIHACVTDPPYAFETVTKRFANSPRNARTENQANPFGRTGRGFMGMRWDTGDTAFSPGFWRQVLRVLRPGAHVVAFGGTRTYHRLACAIEDAGFEIRDQIGWLYGSGMPKSHNQKGDWEGWGTGLKPAWEPIVLARKPLAGTVAANLAAWHVGAINAGACRVDWGADKPSQEEWNRAGSSGAAGGRGRLQQNSEGQKAAYAAGLIPVPEGRWPANIIHDGSDEVIAAFPAAPGQIAKASSSDSRKDQNTYGAMKRGSGGAVPRGDSGSAARFFYCAKASRSDRNDGCDEFDEKPLLWSSGTQSPGTFQSEGTKKAAQNNHPTVKPTDLMRYLCRLVTPPGGTILDPFMGSGSTGRGAVLEGFDFIGVEQDAGYIEIARARIAAAEGRVRAPDVSEVLDAFA